MLKKLRIYIVRQLVELNEHFIFNKKLLKFYKETFGKDLKVVIDVGANLGQTIDIVLKINPLAKIYAFEPNPDLFKELTKKYTQTNIQLFQLGISNTIGEKVFSENILHSTSTLEDLNYSSGYLQRKAEILGVCKKEIIKKKYSIKVTTLSDFISKHVPNEVVDLIKIDTEGHEYSCLAGLFGADSIPVRYIQLESHNDDMYLNSNSSEDIHRILSQNQFTLEAKIRHGFGDFDELIFKNDRS